MSVTPQTETSLPLAFERMFSLEEVGKDRFRSLDHDGRNTRAFGGQLLGQSLVAASRTVEPDRRIHALQVQFRNAGRSDETFEFEVSRVSDGRSFSSRKISVLQSGKLILLGHASFHVPEEGLAYAPSMPKAPEPGQLRSEQDLRAQTMREAGKGDAGVRALAHLGFEMRPEITQNVMQPEVKPPYQRHWVRPIRPVPKDTLIRRGMIAYLSDILFLSSILHAHGIHWASTPMDWASLNHSLWLHEDADFSDWMLWYIQPVWMGGARGMARGSIFDSGGRLVASAVQEGLTRLRP